MHCANSTPSNRKLCVWEIVLLSREVQPRSNHGVALTPGQRTEMDGRADWGETCAMCGLKISQHMQLEEFLGHCYKKPPETTGAVMNSSQITEVCSLCSDVFKCLFRCVVFAHICVLIFTQVCYFCSDVVSPRYANGDQREGFFTDSSLEGQVKTIMSAN